MTEITQADRDAAEEHFDVWYPDTAWGYDPLVEAFARHRQQSTEALRADNARLREALDWAIAEIEGRTIYPGSDQFTSEQQFENALECARAALAQETQP